MRWTSAINLGTVRHFIEEHYDGRALSIAIVKFNAAYVAVRNGSYVYAEVWLMKHPTRAISNLSYKIVPEVDGPPIAECPVKILNLLTPLYGLVYDVTLSEEWRQRCWCSILDSRNSKLPINTAPGTRYKKLTNGIADTIAIEDLIRERMG